MESSEESAHIQEPEDIKTEVATGQSSPITHGSFARKVVTTESTPNGELGHEYAQEKSLNQTCQMSVRPVKYTIVPPIVPNPPFIIGTGPSVADTGIRVPLEPQEQSPGILVASHLIPIQDPTVGPDVISYYRLGATITAGTPDGPPFVQQ